MEPDIGNNLTDEDNENITLLIKKLSELNDLVKSEDIFKVSDNDLSSQADTIHTESITIENHEGRLERIKNFKTIIEKTIDNFNEQITNNIQNITVDSDTFQLFKEKLKLEDEVNNRLKTTRIIDLRVEKLRDYLSLLQQEEGEHKLTKERINNIYDEVKAKNDNLNILIDTAANSKQKKLYDTIYEEEKKLADDYRSTAIKIFSGVAFIATLIFITPWFLGLIHWARTGTYVVDAINILFFVKAIFLFFLSAPGWYFAKESANHRQVAYKAKILGTELASLPFYMKELKEEQRLEMRIKMADKFFGQELYSDKKSDSSSQSEQAKATTEALKVITTLATKIKAPPP